jgi:hypothetical protein
MNEVFKKSKNIILDDKYSLEPDGFKGITLVFSELRKRTKKDETEEMYTFEDRWYYPKLSQVLKKYLSLKQMEAGSLEELLSKVIEVESIIEQFK